MKKTEHWLGGAVRWVLCSGRVASTTTNSHPQSVNPMQSDSTAVE